MAYQDKDKVKPTTWFYWVCPKCKNKAHPDRRHCVCGEILSNGKMCYSESTEKPEMLGVVNIDLPFYSCEKCNNCSYCDAFGVNKKNYEGYGCLDCDHKTNSIKCQCCAIQIKCFQESKGNLDFSIKDGLEKINLIMGKRNGDVTKNYRHKTA